MRIPRIFETSIELTLPAPDFGVFAEIASGPGWTFVPRCWMEKQKCSEWCWAAVGQCIERTFGTSNPEQCAMVQKLIDGGCCATTCSATCNKPRELQLLLTALHHLAGTPKGQIDFPAIVAQINAHRPVCCFIDRGTNHFIVISGFRDTAGRKQIAVLDPLRGGPAQEQDFAAFKIRYEDGTWKQTMLTS